MTLAEHIKTIQQIRKQLDYQTAGKLVYITISGSHLYGFNSPDSDIDYRGAFMTKTENFLGLKTPKDEIQIVEGETDAVLFEMRKELGLLLKSNCNVLEHLYSEPLESSIIHLQLQELVKPTLCKPGLRNSYRGMAYENYKIFILRKRASVKKYLYVYRALMAGIYALETGRIQPNIVELNKKFQIPEVDELVRLKRENTENFETGRQDRYDKKLDELFKDIDEEYKISNLPEAQNIDDIEKIDEWLKKQRRDYLG